MKEEQQFVFGALSTSFTVISGWDLHTILLEFYQELSQIELHLLSQRLLKQIAMRGQMLIGCIDEQIHLDELYSTDHCQAQLQSTSTSSWKLR